MADGFPILFLGLFSSCASRLHVCLSGLVFLSSHARVYVCTIALPVRLFVSLCMNKALTESGYKVHTLHKNGLYRGRTRQNNEGDLLSFFGVFWCIYGL